MFQAVHSNPQAMMTVPHRRLGMLGLFGREEVAAVEAANALAGDSNTSGEALPLLLSVGRVEQGNQEARGAQLRHQPPGLCFHMPRAGQSLASGESANHAPPPSRILCVPSPTLFLHSRVQHLAWRTSDRPARITDEEHFQGTSCHFTQ